MNHAVQNYVSANLMLWTMKNCAKIVLILQCCNSALLGRFVFKNHTQVPKLIYFQSLLEVFAQDVTLGGCLSKYRRAFIVYIFRQPPEVWSLVSDNSSISGTGKASIEPQIEQGTNCSTLIFQTFIRYRLMIKVSILSIVRLTDWWPDCLEERNAFNDRLPDEQMVLMAWQASQGC